MIVKAVTRTINKARVRTREKAKVRATVRTKTESGVALVPAARERRIVSILERATRLAKAANDMPRTI